MVFSGLRLSFTEFVCVGTGLIVPVALADRVDVPLIERGFAAHSHDGN
jgi:hypothetical protein